MLCLWTNLVKNNQIDIMNILCINHNIPKNSILFDYAILYSNFETIKFLIEKCEYKDLPSRYININLHKRGDIDIYKYISTIFSFTNENNQYIKKIEECHSIDIFNYILENCSNINMTNILLKCLKYKYNNNFDIIKKILTGPYNIDIHNNNDAIFNIAVRFSNQLDVVKLLLSFEGDRYIKTSVLDFRPLYNYNKTNIEIVKYLLLLTDGRRIDVCAPLYCLEVFNKAIINKDFNLVKLLCSYNINIQSCLPSILKSKSVKIFDYLITRCGPVSYYHLSRTRLNINIFKTVLKLNPNEKYNYTELLITNNVNYYKYIIKHAENIKDPICGQINKVLLKILKLRQLQFNKTKCKIAYYIISGCLQCAIQHWRLKRVHRELRNY